MRDFGFYWRMIRPHTLSASYVPVFVGTALALGYKEFHPIRFIAMLLASLAIQIATNLFNEYFDYLDGTDTVDSIGNSGTIVRDGASPRFVMQSALVLYALSLLLGLYLCFSASWWLAPIGVVCMLCGYVYGGGPYPLSRTPLGELFSGGFMGIGIVMIAYYIQTLHVTWDSFFIALPIALLIAQIMTANNLRDRENDGASGRKTLAVLFGHKKTVAYMKVIYVLAYGVLFAQVFFHHGMFLALVLLAVPTAKKSIARFTPTGQTNKQMMPAMGMVAKHTKQFGLLLTLALLIEAGIRFAFHLL